MIPRTPGAAQARAAVTAGEFDFDNIIPVAISCRRPTRTALPFWARDVLCFPVHRKAARSKPAFLSDLPRRFGWCWPKQIDAKSLLARDEDAPINVSSIDQVDTG